MASPVANFLNVGRMQDEKRKLDRDAELERQAKVREDLDKQKLDETKRLRAVQEDVARIRADKLRLQILTKQATLKQQDAQIKDTEMFLRKASSLKTSDTDFQTKLALVAADYPLAMKDTNIRELVTSWNADFKVKMSAQSAKDRHEADLAVARKEADAVRARFNQHKDAYAAAQAKAKAYREQKKEVPPEVSGTLEYQRDQMKSAGQRLIGLSPQDTEEVNDTISQVNNDHLTGLQAEHANLESQLSAAQTNRDRKGAVDAANSLNRVKREINTLVPASKQFNPATGATEPMPDVLQGTTKKPVESVADQPPVAPKEQEAPKKPLPVTQEPPSEEQQGPTLLPIPDAVLSKARENMGKGADVDALSKYFVSKGYDPAPLSQSETPTQ